MIGQFAMVPTISPCQQVGSRETQEQVGTPDRLLQRQPAPLRGKFQLFGRKFAAIQAHDPFAVEEEDVGGLDTHGHQHLETCDSRGASPEGDDPDVLDPLARHPQGVRRRRGDHDGGSMLVIVENGNVHPFPAEPFHEKAVRCLDVLEIDRAERRFEADHQFREPLRVRLVHFDVEAIEIREFLEQDRLALHDRLCGQCTYVSEAKNRRPVRNHCHQVSLGGVAERIHRIALDPGACLGDTRRIGAGQVPAGRHRLRCPDFQFPRFRKLVVIKRRLLRRLGLQFLGFQLPLLSA